MEAKDSGRMLSGTFGVRETSARSAPSTRSSQRVLKDLLSHLSEAQIQIIHDVHVQNLLKANNF